MFSYFAAKPAFNPDMTPLQAEDPDPEWPAQAIGLHASMSAVRAWKNGTGNYKLAGNYAPTLLHINKRVPIRYDKYFETDYLHQCLEARICS